MERNLLKREKVPIGSDREVVPGPPQVCTVGSLAVKLYLVDPLAAVGNLCFTPSGEGANFRNTLDILYSWQIMTNRQD